MKRRGLCFALVVFALAAFLIGCGGSDSQPLSKAQFEKRAKALCEKRSQQYYEEALAASRKMAQDGRTVSLADEAKILANTVVPGMESKMEAVRELEPPAVDAAQVDRILDAIEVVVAQAKADPKLFIHRQVYFKRPFHHANELAKGYGLSKCARA